MAYDETIHLSNQGIIMFNTILTILVAIIFHVVKAVAVTAVQLLGAFILFVLFGLVVSKYQDWQKARNAKKNPTIETI